MDKFDIRRVAEGLTVYAIERQNGFKRWQQDGIPSWMEQRRFWTDAILQGMARLDGEEPDPKLMEQFDRVLKQARGCYFFHPGHPPDAEGHDPGAAAVRVQAGG